jgi:hypothetical protein
VAIRRAVLFFVLGSCLLSMASGIFEPTVNNYLDATFHISEKERGDLELPREFPGFMVAALAGSLLFLGEGSMAVVAAALVAAGLLGLAVFAHQSQQYASMVFFLACGAQGPIWPCRSPSLWR